MRDEETVLIPARYLCPYCSDRAESYSSYRESRDKYALENRLRDGSASMPERIKAAWAMYGKGWDWEKDGPVVHVPEYNPFTLSYRDEMEDTPQVFTTFRFYREETYHPDLTVTRVHCRGVTVEETYS